VDVLRKLSRGDYRIEGRRVLFGLTVNGARGENGLP